MTWHVGGETLDAYARGALDGFAAMSVEAHLPSCTDCRARLPVDRARMDRLWDGIRTTAAASRPGVVERVLTWLRVPQHVARLLSATPSLSASWLLAVVVALAFAVAAARTGGGGQTLFIAVAPLVPLLGVAAAYGPGIDPAYEVGLVAPMSAMRLLFVRAAAVLAVSIVVLGAVSLFLPGEMGAVLWLVPALALAAAGLALGMVASPLRAAAGLSVLWIVTSVTAALVTGDAVRAARADLQVILGMLAVAAAWAAWIKRDGAEVRRSRR
jgi:hypothetical protein